MANVELATAYISLVPTMKGAQGSIARELGAVDADGIGKGIGGRMGGGIVGTMKGLVGPAIAAVAAVGLGGFIAEAAAASDATDKFKSTMNFAGIDTSGIEAATAAAKAYADQTVYDLPTIQATMAQLASNGVSGYTELTEAAGNLNAVAGGNAETFKSVSRTLTQSAGAGKLMTEDWNMLADAIPGAAGPLKSALEDAGAYTGNFKEAMEKGQITSDEFQASLLKLGMDPIAVEAGKSVTTFEGAIGGLQATINSGLMGALDAMKPAITGAINLLSNGLGKAFDFVGNAATGLYDLIVKGDFTGALTAAFGWEEDSAAVDFLFTARDGVLALKAAFTEGDVTSDGFVGVMERIGVGAREVIGGVRAMFAAYQAGDGEITSSGFAGFMERVGLGLREVTGGVRAFFAAFAAGGDDVTSSGFAGFLEGLGLKARALFDQIGPAIGQIFGTLGPILAPLIPQFMSLIGAMSPMGTIFQAIAPMLPQLLDVFVQLAAVVGQSLGQALTAILPVFVQLQAVFVSVFQQVLATALPVIVQLVSMLGQTFAQLLPVIVPIITQVVALAATLISQLAPIFMQLVSTVLPMVVTIFGAVLQAIGPLISMIAGLLMPIIQALMPVVVTVFGVIADVIGSVMQIVMGIIQVVTGVISGNWSQVWEGIGNIFGGIWNTIVSVVGGAIGIVWSVISAGIGMVLGFIGGALNNIGKFFSDTWNNVTRGISDFVGGIGKFFESIPGTIMGVLSGAGQWLFDAGKNIVQGLFDGIKSLAGTIGNFFLGLLPGWIVEPFKVALGIHSPSRVFRGLGVNIGEGLLLGVDDMESKIDAKMGGLVTVPAAPTYGAATAAGDYRTTGGFGQTYNIYETDDPIATAHAVSRRQSALSA